MKTIRINKPMPDNIRKSLDAKQRWIEDVQSGKIQVVMSFDGKPELRIGGIKLTDNSPNKPDNH